MAMPARIRELRAAVGRGAVALWFVLGVAACGTAPAGDGSPFVLTTRGDFAQSNAPRGVEVTLGSKLIHPADAPGRPD
jgi:hypothetical protein